MEAARDLGDDRSRVVLEANLDDRVRPLSPRTLEQAQEIPRPLGPQATEDLAGSQDLLIDGSPRHRDGVPTQTGSNLSGVDRTDRTCRPFDGPGPGDLRRGVRGSEGSRARKLDRREQEQRPEG